MPPVSARMTSAPAQPPLKVRSGSKVKKAVEPPRKKFKDVLKLDLSEIIMTQREEQKAMQIEEEELQQMSKV